MPTILTPTLLPPRMRRIFAVSLGATLGLVVLAALIIVLAPAPVEASTCSLTSTAPTTNWTDTTKWSGCAGTYPGANAGDTAVVGLNGFTLNVDAVIPNGVVLQLTGNSINTAIPSGSALQIEASSSSTSANTININGGQLAVGAGLVAPGGILALNTGTLALTGTLSNAAGGIFTVNGGTISGPGTLLINTSTSVSFTGSGGGMNISGAVIDDFGTVTYSSNSSQSLSLLNGANFKVESGGQFNITGNDPILSNNVSSPAFNIFSGGAMSKSNGTTTQIDPIVNNAGSVTVTVGRLNLYGGGSHIGAFSTGTGGTTMGFSGAHIMNSGATAAGGGTYELDGGTLDVNTPAVSPWSPLLFEQTGGTLQGTGTIRVTGTFTWTGGTQTAGGTTELTGTTNVNGGSVTLTGGRLMFNSGTLNYAPTTGFLTIDGGAHVDNTGTWDLQNDAIINSSSPATSYILTNGTGLFKKSGGTLSSVNCALQLNGQATLQPAAGKTISLGGGTGSGTFGGSTAVIDLTGASSEVYLAGGTFVFAAGGGGLVVNGSGVLRLANAVLQLTSGPLTVSNFDFDGTSGLLQSAGPGISINGAGGVFTWDGGTVDGSSAGVDVITVNGPSGTLNITGATGSLILQDGARIKNVGGSINFNPPSSLAVNSGSVIANTSGSFTFNNANSAGITTDNVGNPLFTNSGSVTKAANPNTVQVDLKFNSTTTFTVNGGTLRLMGGGTDNGSMIATNAADRIEIGAGTFNMSAGATVGGSGTFAVNAGATLANNTALNTTNFELGGTVNGGGTLTVNNGFKWLCGGFSGVGSATIPASIVTNATALTGAPTLADGFTFNNNGIFNYNPTFSLTFSNSGGGGATFNNNAGATFDIQGNGTTSTTGAGNALGNAGTIKKSAGAGTFTFDVRVVNQGSGIVDEQFGSGSTIAFNNNGDAMTGGTIKASSAAGNIDLTGGTMSVTGGAFAGPGAINLKGATLTVNAAQTFPPIFNMSSGQLNGTQTIDIPSGAAFNWSGGTITGSSGSPISILSGGALNADSTTSSLIYDTRPLMINAGGNFNWNAGSNSLIFQSLATVNDSGAFTVTTNATLGSAAAGSFSVVGTFTHNASGTLTVTLPLSAAAGGTITSTGGGILTLTNLGLHSGTLDAQSGSFIDFGGNTQQMNAGSAFGAGTGTYKLTAGLLNLLTNLTAPNFGILGGALTGSGNLDTTSSFSWSGGQMAGTGTTTVAGGTASFTGGPLTLNRNLVIGAPTTMNAAGGLTVQTTATITNNSTFNLLNGSVTCVSCTTASFANNGTIQKSAVSVSNWSVPITGSGALSMTAGTFADQAAATFNTATINNSTADFSGSPITIGSVSGTGSTVLQVSGGSTSVSGATSLSGGVSQIRVTGGALSFGGAASADGLIMTGGTISGAGALTLNTLSSLWSGGTIGGSGALVLNASLTIDGASGAMVLARNLTNNSTVTYNPPNATQTLTVNAPAGITNNAAFNVTGGFDLMATGAPLFTNAAAGTLTRSGSPNAINFALAVANAGTTNVSSGTTTFTNAYSQSGGATTLANATIGSPTPFNFTGGVFNARGTINGDVVINGAAMNPGTSPGIANIAGNYTQSSTGTLNIELNGTVAGTSYDQLNVSGNANLAGTLNVTVGYTPSNNDLYDVLTIGGTRTGDFATKNLPTLPGPGTLSATYLAGPPETLRIQALVPNPDLTLSVSAPSAVLHGQNATLTFTITNLGSNAANSVTFTDAFTNATLVSVTSTGTCTTTSGVSCALGSLAGGASTNVVIQLNASSLGSITSNANVTHSVTDPTPANNNVVSSITVNPASDFGIFSVSAPASVNAGANFPAAVTVKNGGPDAGAPNLNVTVSGGTIVSASGGGFTCTTTATSASCTGASIAPSSTAALNLVLTAQLAPGTVVINATTSSAADPNAANNSGSASSTIGNIADIVVVKTGPPTATGGASVTYTISVTNNGPSDATSISLDDPTPSRLTFVSATGACTAFPCSLGTLTAGQTATVQATYSVVSGPPVSITNIASATTATLETNTNNNAGFAVTAIGCSGQAPTPLSPAANATVGTPATFSWSAVPGAIDYTVTINAGGTIITLGPTSATSISTPLPDGSAFWNVSANFGGNCTAVPSANVPFIVCSGNASPVLRMVSESLSGQIYTGEWDPLVGATKYEIDESADETFTAPKTTTVTNTSITFQHTATTPTPFFYRVRAFLPCAGKFGPYSTTSRVVIAPPPSPNDPNPNVNVPVGSKLVVVQIVHVPGFGGGSVNFTAIVDKPWLSVTPASGILPPGGVDLTVIADPTDLPNGTFTGTVIVTIITPSTASGIVAQGETTSKTPVSISLVTPVSSTAKTAIPANALIIPSVGHLPGINSKWQSDIRLANTGFTKTKYQLTFTPTGDDASKPVKQTIIEVDAGATTALDDIVRNWYGVGSLGETANGVLEIHPTASAGKGSIEPNVDISTTTVVSSRTYNVSPQGTLGQFIPAVPFASFVGKAASGGFAQVLGLQQIAQSSAFRTNLGLVEAAGKPATVLVNVFDAGNHNVFSQTVNLAAGEQKQLNSFLAANDVTLTDGRIEVQVTDGDGRITAYASRIDNASGDPLLVSGVPLRAQGASHFVLPGIATLDTGFANWQSDVRLFNATDAPITPTITFYPQNNSGTPQATALTIAPGETTQLDGVLQNLFGLANAAGALHITTPSDANLVISGRTYNQTSNGTFGQFIPAVTSADAVGAGARGLQILQVEDSVRYRTNVGIAEVTGKPATVELSVFLPDSKVVPKTQFTVGANEFRQFAVLQELGLENVYNARIQIRVLSGEGKVAAYGSVVDMRTQDPTYVPAQ